jgi:hypothetical protein
MGRCKEGARGISAGADRSGCILVIRNGPADKSDFGPEEEYARVHQPFSIARPLVKTWNDDSEEP